MSSLESNLPSADESRAPPRAMIKPLLILVVAVAVVLGGIYGWQRFVATKFIGPMMKAMATAPQTVSTMTAVKSSWQSRSEAQGTVRAVRGADLSAQASGVVDTLHIESGAEVRAGTVLLTLKPNDDPAKLAQLQAQAEIDAVTLKRDQEQLAAQAVSQATVDVDAANLKSARAQVAAQQALIEEKTVRAPFAGKLGLRQVDEGQYLAAGTTIVTLQALDPIFIDFYVPQQALARLKVRRERDGGDRCLSRGDLHRQDHLDQLQGRQRQPQRPDPRELRECRPAPGSRHVRQRRDRQWQPRGPGHHPAIGGHLQPVWRHRVPGPEGRRQGPSEPHGAAAVREARRNARRSGRRAHRRRRRGRGGDRRPAEAAQWRGGA